MRENFQLALEKIYPNDQIALIDYHMPRRTSHEVYFVAFLNKDTNKKNTIVFKFFSGQIHDYKCPSLKKEVDVIRGLEKGGYVNVPKIIYHENSDVLFGKDFFVMEKIIGVPISESISHSQSIEKKKQYVRQSAELIVRIHNTDLGYFPSLKKREYAEIIIDNFNRLFVSLKNQSNFIKSEDLKLMQETIELLKNKKPRETDFALINGDLSPAHFISTREGICTIIDWDPAEIGDKSWDLYWMIKEIPQFVFGYDNALDDLISSYESIAGEELKNKEFYSKAALGWAYVLGWYIEERIPSHDMVPAIKEFRPSFVKKLEKML